MADGTGISWTDATWNPIVGCTRVSSGCAYCYAVKSVWRLSHNPAIGEQYRGLVVRQPNGQLDWTGEVKLFEDRLGDPLGWKKPRRIFVNSLSDLFHEAVPDDFVDQVWAVMMLSPQHTFQVLTKRPERMRDFLGDPRRLDKVLAVATQRILAGEGPRPFPRLEPHHGRWPLPNVWGGTSIEDQPRYDERAPILMTTRLAVRFLSLEPLLGEVALRGVRMPPDGAVCDPLRVVEDSYPPTPWPVGPIHWVIVGGESGGPKVRRLVERCIYTYEFGHGTEYSCSECQNTGWAPTPVTLAWARSLRDQCQGAGTAFYFKQWGGPTSTAGGDLLDGRQWHQYPTPTGV